MKCHNILAYVTSCTRWHTLQCLDDFRLGMPFIKDQVIKLSLPRTCPTHVFLMTGSRAIQIVVQARLSVRTLMRDLSCSCT